MNRFERKRQSVLGFHVSSCGISERALRTVSWPDSAKLVRVGLARSHLPVALLAAILVLGGSAYAQTESVPEETREKIVEDEKKPDAKEKTETGEASGNVSDCEPLHEEGDGSKSVEAKDLDECKPLVK